MASQTRILIVDDNTDTVELLTKRLRAEGYETIAAFDGEEALAKVASTWPDLIILDVMMPKLGGFEVCERLKSSDATRFIPILMLTAKSDTPDRVKGFETGADDYLSKPFDYKELSVRVRSLLDRKEASRKLAEEEKLGALDHMVEEVAHEVRNPLVVIGGLARRVMKSLPENSQNREYLQIILKNVAVLEKMVEQLFALKTATLTAIAPADPNGVIEEALRESEPLFRENGVEVRTDLATPAPRMPLDRENMKKALCCLLENAVEAMQGSPGLVEVQTTYRSGTLVLTVRDNGKGIPREKLKSIFDPFYSSKLYGPGLGLPFVQKTVHSHRGAITVTSEAGKGTVFTIELPGQGVELRGG